MITISSYTSCLLGLTGLFTAQFMTTGLPGALCVMTILGSVSPLIAASIMILPLVVIKTSAELDSLPLGMPMCVQEIAALPSVAHTALNTGFELVPQVEAASIPAPTVVGAFSSLAATDVACRSRALSQHSRSDEAARVDDGLASSGPVTDVDVSVLLARDAIERGGTLAGPFSSASGGAACGSLQPGASAGTADSGSAARGASGSDGRASGGSLGGPRTEGRGLKFLQPRLFAVTFFPALNRQWHRALHMSAVSLGVSLGWAYIIFSLSISDIARAGLYWYLQLVLLCISVVSMGVFAVMTALEGPSASITWKRSSFLFEYIGLLYYIMSLVYTAIVMSSFLQGGDIPARR